MNGASLKDTLRGMRGRHPGIRGCAVVDSSSSLVWHSEPVGEPDDLWEAAVDHWRLHRRLSRHFDALGEPGAIVTYHRGATMALLPCLPVQDVILVCVAAPSSVDWAAWQDEARALGGSIVASS